MFHLFDDESWGMLIKIILTIVMLVTGWLGYLFIPDMLEAKRAAIKSSSGYIESSQSKLNKLAQEYNDCKIKIKQLEMGDSSFADLIKDYKLQKNVLLESIRMESEKIPDYELPESIINILEEK